ncbi:hypothetical protein BH09PSE5_BH09PSE5_36820 [soil metagenome]
MNRISKSVGVAINIGGLALLAQLVVAHVG